MKTPKQPKPASPTQRKGAGRFTELIDGAARALEAIPVRMDSVYWKYRQKQVDILRAALSQEAHEQRVAQVESIIKRNIPEWDIPASYREEAIAVLASLGDSPQPAQGRGKK